MRRVVDALLVLVAVCLTSLAFYRNFVPARVPPSTQDQVNALRGTKLPRVSVRLADGATIVAPDHRATTLLYFMSTTCGACQQNESRWDALRDSLAAIVVPIAISLEGEEVLRSYWSLRHPKYSVGMIPIEGQDSLVEAYRLYATPTVYAIASDGTLKGGWVGVLSDSTMRDIISTVRRAYAQ